MKTETSPRILLYTGKGGVGKTTTAAATALRCADAGLRTIVLSTDTAHSLGDSFETDLGPVPKKVSDNLWAQECDVYYNLETYWGTVQSWVEALLTWRGMDNVMAEEIAVFPGMEELANLLWVNRHVSSGEFDVIVVDCAPTGETLRLLAFPEVGRWWIDKLLPINRQLTRIVRPMARHVTDLPFPDDDVFVAMTDLVDQLDRLHQLLTASNSATVRLVINPEKMVIREAQRSYTYLTLYDHVTDAIVVNRVIPKDADGSFAEQIRQMQAPHMKNIHEMFDPTPVLEVEQFSSEILGLEQLRKMGHLLHHNHAPEDVLITYKPYDIVPIEGGFEFQIPAQFLDKADATLVRRGDELVIRMGAARRNIVLPRALARMKHSQARLENGRLLVRFTPRTT